MLATAVRLIDLGFFRPGDQVASPGQAGRREVCGYLANTPAVARSSYIDPRVIERYEEGRTIARALGDLGRGLDFGELSTRGGAERAVLQLLRRRS